MTNETTAIIDLRFDVSEAAASIAEVNNLFDGLQKATQTIAGAISNAFTPVVSSLKVVQAGIGSVAESLSKTANSLAGVKTAASANEESGGLFDTFVAGYEAIVKGVGKMEEVEKSSGKIYSAFADVVTAPNLSGLMKSMLPKTAEVFDAVGDWTKMLGNTITQKFSEISPKIGANATEMLKSVTSAFSKFGSALGGLSVGKGAVIAIAIAAIVALVKLIVDNWDAIKAALGTAAEWFNTNIIQPIVGFFTGLWTSITNIVSNIWNGIVSVCTGVAQWVQDNVIQPVVGFFKTAFEWISTKLQAGFAFVQSIFTGISGFMQGVVVRDCRFSEVLFEDRISES